MVLQYSEMTKILDNNKNYSNETLKGHLMPHHHIDFFGEILGIIYKEIKSERKKDKV